MFFDKIVKIEKNYVERVENINIKVYTTNCVDNMQIDHLIDKMGRINLKLEEKIED